MNRLFFVRLSFLFLSALAGTGFPASLFTLDDCQAFVRPKTASLPFDKSLIIRTLGKTIAVDSLEYAYLFGSTLSSHQTQVILPLVIAKRESGRAVAIVRLFNDQIATSLSREQFKDIYQVLRRP